MTRLEFIKKEIEKIIFKLIEETEKREKFAGQNAWNTVNYLDSYIKKLADDRDILYQIKNELEAWEVVKKCLSISTDSRDEYSKSFEFISFTVAGIHPLLGFDRQEIESIKKALEVE